MIRRLILALAVLVAAWLAVSAVLFVWPRAASTPQRADAVIVLSGGRDSRLDPAIVLVERGTAPLLVISSAAKDPKWRKARRLCAAGHLTGSVRVLCFEATPFSTRGEAHAIARLARERHWKRVVVVSSTYHLTRARMLIRRCYHGGLDMVGTRSRWWRLPEEWGSELGKLAVQLTFERDC